MTIRILLCDLTYTQQTISSDVMPAGIGSIAAYLLENIDEEIELSLFKYPEDLSACLQELDSKKLPIHIAGFSNYVWNRNLSLSFADIVKRNFKKTVIVFGGPNIPTDLSEQEVFLRDNSVIDFHIVKEGEKPFFNLVSNLIRSGFEKEKITNDQSNLVFIGKNNLFQASERVERTLSLEELPSPYQSGLMDKFFDGKLVPIIQTNRGCPFMCTFCTEGMNYWSKVYTSSQEKIDQEISFIAQKMSSLGRMKRSDLHIADSNFGMYKQDLETAKSLRMAQNKYDYPKYINVATGKNKTERVLEVAKIVNGAMKLTGAVQSLDSGVLENIKRSNIGADQIIELGKSAEEVGANSYSEVILGLPGDTVPAHFKTLETLVNAEFNAIYMYQFMILPGTESGSVAAQEKYNMTTRWRLLPRCYGYYDVLGEKINVAEAEEICVSHDTLNFDDYLDCRKMNFIVNVFFNDGVFRELLDYLKWERVPVWKWFLNIYSGMEKFEKWSELLEKFLQETEQELWAERDKLIERTKNRKSIKKYIEGRQGGNLMFKYKALSMTQCLSDVGKVAREAAIDVLRNSATHSPEKEIFVDEVVKYNLCRMSDIFVPNPQSTSYSFKYDISKFWKDGNPALISDYAYAEPRTIRFGFTDEQLGELEKYIKLFGHSEHGISRILSRIYIRKLYRNAQGGEIDPDHEAHILSKGQAALSGLNEFD